MTTPKAIKVAGVMAVVLGLGIACTKTAKTQPQFIFKSAPDKSAAAKINNKIIPTSELFNGIESELYEAQMKVHEIKMNKLKAYALKKFMEADPAYKGDSEAFLDKVTKGNIKISTKQIDAFVKERKIPKEHLNDQMKERIKQFLEKEEKVKAIDAWLSSKTKASPIEYYFEEPKRPVFDVAITGAPTFGPSDAKVTVVEFSDYQCPFCAKGATIITDLKKKYGNKIQVAFKNFPLPFHKQAGLAAEASMCANEQSSDYFWKMHDALFADQTKLAKEELIKTANKIGLDKAKFSTCLDSGKFKNKVNTDMEDGKKVGVKSTPTFFVNGMMINGAQPVDVFSKIIDKELAK